MLSTEQFNVTHSNNDLNLETNGDSSSLPLLVSIVKLANTFGSIKEGIPFFSADRVFCIAVSMDLGSINLFVNFRLNLTDNSCIRIKPLKSNTGCKLAISILEFCNFAIMIFLGKEHIIKSPKILLYKLATNDDSSTSPYNVVSPFLYFSTASFHAFL